MVHVSVIVPVKGEVGGLNALLDSLTHQNYPPHHFEVVVVHNARKGLRIEPRPGLTVRLLNEPAPGSYAARNLGVDCAAGEMLAFTDADCVAHPDWLSRGVSAVRQYPRAIVAGEIQIFAGQAQANLAERHQLAFAFDQDVNVAKGRGLPTANVFVRADVFRDVGLFNPRMLSGGDAEWSKRALRHGYPWRIEPKALVYHPARTSFRELRAQRARFASAIHVQPTSLRRLGWYLNWISPRQGLVSRLKQRSHIRKRDWPGLVLAQLGLAFFQMGIGLSETLRSTVSLAPQTLDTRQTGPSLSREAA